MKINVKKLDSTIAKLQELRRLATDPDLTAFVQVGGARAQKNGSSDVSTVQPTPSKNGHNGRGALTPAVLTACTKLRNFTIKDVLLLMQAEGYEFRNGDGAEKSIANVLRKLVEDGSIQVAEKGYSRNPTKYAVN
jgi:hypothetical protein